MHSCHHGRGLVCAGGVQSEHVDLREQFHEVGVPTGARSPGTIFILATAEREKRRVCAWERASSAGRRIDDVTARVNIKERQETYPSCTVACDLQGCMLCIVSDRASEMQWVRDIALRPRLPSSAFSEVRVTSSTVRQQPEPCSSASRLDYILFSSSPGSRLRTEPERLRDGRCGRERRRPSLDRRSHRCCSNVVRHVPADLRQAL